MRALLYVQHLLGSGHLKRTVLIANELRELGVEVHLVTGGMPVDVINTDHLNVHQLEPVRAADSSFSSLVDSAGQPVSEDLKAARIGELGSIAQTVEPDVVLIETWPFGRRQLRHELLEFCRTLHEQQPRPVIACSIRDILQRGRKPERVAETVGHVNHWLDNVLVHADPEFISLQQSFERFEDIEDKVVYTGFVSQSDSEPDDWQGAESNEVLVSAGGGAGGELLYQLCIEAARFTEDEIRWRILVGGGLDPGSLTKLKDKAAPSVTVEPARSDFPQLLRDCALSISQAGYNTTMDLVRCGCPAIVVPFEEGAETEQLDRAQRLDELGIAKSVRLKGLSPAALAEEVRRQLHRRPASSLSFRTAGARWTANWLLQRING